jgi:ABC-type branched-subunit amino acid transport system substrate-binding protein
MPARKSSVRRAAFCAVPAPALLRLVLLALGVLSACAPVARPAVKIGLVGPFEGRYRDTGYEVIYAVRLAVREANQRGLGGYGLELLSLDDSGEADMALTQAKKMATDPQVVGVVGHWLDETTLAAAPAYAEAGLPLLATTPSPQLHSAAFRLWPSQSNLVALIRPDWKRSARPFEPGWGQTPFWSDGGPRLYLLAPAPMPADTPDPAFAQRYRALSNGVEPNAYAVLAYDAARLLCDAITRDVAAHGRPTRAGVAAALRESNRAGLSGTIRFDADQAWAGAAGRVYGFEGGQVVEP